MYIHEALPVFGQLRFFHVTGVHRIVVLAV
jgi:hypothetical protein